MIPQPLLTVAIPSYNRAPKLDAQIQWAVTAINGRWNLCQLLVSDNASTDDTPQVTAKWQRDLGDKIAVVRQPQNLGLIKNTLQCMTQARGQFVWAVGDDDTIFPDTFDAVLSVLQQHPETGLIHLNLRTTDSYGGAVLEERVYPQSEDEYCQPGHALFQRCLQVNDGYMALITAIIVDQKMVRQALDAWPGVAQNYGFPIYISGFAAAKKAMYFRSTPSLDYPHHTGSHLGRWLATIYCDIPAVYPHLLKLGYDPAFMRRMILGRASFLSFMARFPLQFLKSLRVYSYAFRLPRA